jgi:hypothetical protein
VVKERVIWPLARVTTRENEDNTVRCFLSIPLVPCVAQLPALVEFSSSSRFAPIANWCDSPRISLNRPKK